jgi:hypothetical protein
MPEFGHSTGISDRPSFAPGMFWGLRQYHITAGPFLEFEDMDGVLHGSNVGDTCMFPASTILHSMMVNWALIITKLSMRPLRAPSSSY